MHLDLYSFDVILTGSNHQSVNVSSLWLRREWGKSRIGFDEVAVSRCCGTGSTPLSLFYLSGREGIGASLGLAANEVTVPWCFWTNRKVYKCHPRPITSLYILGRVLSANICFRNRGDHGKTSMLLGFATPWTRDYIQTLSIYENVKDRLYVKWEVIHDSFQIPQRP